MGDGRFLSHDAVLTQVNEGGIKCVSSNFEQVGPSLALLFEQELDASKVDASIGMVLLDGEVPVSPILKRRLSDHFEQELDASKVDASIGMVLLDGEVPV